MAAYVLQDKPDRILDPAVGEGAFFRAIRRHAQRHNVNPLLFGRDIDAKVIAQAQATGLSPHDLRHVELRDFVLDPPTTLFPAIIANPPYIRHHRLPPSQKQRLREFVCQSTGLTIDARAGLHVYFLIRALQTLAPKGRLAFIVSADICEGVFAPALWQWICSRYRLDAVITFAPEAAPFPDVDTNALVLLIRNTSPAQTFIWAKCKERNSSGLAALATNLSHKQYPGLQVYQRSLGEGLTTGLSRPPSNSISSRYTLSQFASVMRGIVTGDNDFFFMTSARAQELGIPDALLVTAVGRTRDIIGDQFTQQDLLRLENQNRPTRLLNVNGVPFDRLPKSVQKYLKSGEQKGLPAKTLIRTRNPWYRMETRKIPPILFAYLGRRSTRFIRNRAGAVPLTCLLCVYPHQASAEFLASLWAVVSDPETIQNLKKVGKSYGGGAIKVEPRALERLPLPDHLVHSTGLAQYLAPQQAEFDFNRHAPWSCAILPGDDGCIVQG